MSYDLILGSASPRRKELLARLCPDFVIKVPHVCEVKFADSAALLLDMLNSAPGIAETVKNLPMTTAAQAALVKLNAEIKAEKIAALNPNDVVLAADTIVVWDGKTIGKPQDLADAVRILRLLSGQIHYVFTAVVLQHNLLHKKYSFIAVTKVKFKPYSMQTINEYLQLVAVLDKAGGYGIQEHGAMLCESYDGELENIIGLPLQQLSRILPEWLD